MRSSRSDGTVTAVPWRRSRTSAGVEVVSEVVPGASSVSVGVWVGVGSRDEDQAAGGSSHLLEHLVFCGTELRSGPAIAAAVEGAGGAMNAFTTQEETCFYARCLGDDLELVFGALAEMVRSATLSDASLAAELPVVLGEFAEAADDADRVMEAALLRARFGDHPLARPVLGERDRVAVMPGLLVREHFARFYRPGSLVVSAAGAVDHDRLVDWCERLLGDMGRPGSAPLRRVPPAGEPEPVALVPHGDDRASALARVSVTFPTAGSRDESQAPALAVLATLLGGGMSSRLFTEVRERRGLAYSTFSQLLRFDDAGLLSAYAAVAPSAVAETSRVLRGVVEGLASSVSPVEVERACRRLVAGRRMASDDPADRMRHLGSRTLSGSTLRSVGEAVALLEAVDAAQVRALAASLVASPATVTVAGPRQALTLG